MPTVTYQDETVSVEVDVNMHDEEGISISDVHGHRDLSNSIKINVLSPNAHFIQFVTRIVPDMFEFGQSRKTQWNSDLVTYASHYMPSHNIPRWKIDTADDSCFYDSAGVHKRTANSTAMYDCPGGAYQIREERVIFCTFVTVEDKVTHKIQWSKQYEYDTEEKKYKEFYMVKGQKCESLPNWAIKTITEDPLCTTMLGTHKVFELPEQLRSGYNKDLVRTESDLLLQAKEDLLPPPENWITKVSMPGLFSSPQQPALASSLLEELGQTWSSPRDNSLELELATPSVNLAVNLAGKLVPSSSQAQEEHGKIQPEEPSSSSSQPSTSTGSRPGGPK